MFHFRRPHLQIKAVLAHRTFPLHDVYFRHQTAALSACLRTSRAELDSLAETRPRIWFHRRHESPPACSGRAVGYTFERIYFFGTNLLDVATDLADGRFHHWTCRAFNIFTKEIETALQNDAGCQCTMTKKRPSIHF